MDLGGLEPPTSSVRLRYQHFPQCPQLIYGCIKSIQSPYMGGQNVQAVHNFHAVLPALHPVAPDMKKERRLISINHKSQFRSLIDLVSPFAQIVGKPKIARQACQAVPFQVMGGSGPVPNRLPHVFRTEPAPGTMSYFKFDFQRSYC